VLHRDKAFWAGGEHRQLGDPQSKHGRLPFEPIAQRTVWNSESLYLIDPKVSFELLNEPPYWRLNFT
jgi:hypothetical protein